MKRYIRTKDGKIIDLDGNVKYCRRDLYKDLSREEWWTLVQAHDFIKTTDIVAESDNITDLIMVGDLVEYTDYIYGFDMTNLLRVILTCDLVNDDILAMKPYCCDENELQKLYTKQGDNYVLVWDKERGVI